MKHCRPNAARIERYQWQSGHKLELVPLTGPLYKKWVCKLFGTHAPQYLNLRDWLWFDSGSEPLYFAKHWTGFEPDLIFANEPYPRLGYKLVASAPIARLVLDKNCWWVGPHIALPRPNLHVMTPVIGTIEMLRPPEISKKWAKRVTSFDSPAARKWAQREDR